MTNLLCNLIFVSVAFLAHLPLLAAEAGVKLKVTCENGASAPNVETKILFQGTRWEQNHTVFAKTNEHGVWQVSGWSKDPEFLERISVSCITTSYYISIIEVPVAIDAKDAENLQLNLELLVRKKVNPIPMYAKKVEIELPIRNKEIGFDFEKSDWVKPYGQGEVADCTFLGTKNYTDWDNNKTTVVVSFGGMGAGLQLDPAANNEAFRQCEFKTSRTAPTHDYEQSKVFLFQESSDEGRKGSTSSANYLFRSRTQTGHDGKIVKCHYGKLIDAVDVMSGAGLPETNPRVSFTYYFNPTPNDRNLEFDPKKNLFENLDPLEEVHAP